MTRMTRLLVAAAVAGLAIAVPAVGPADATPPTLPDAELAIPADPPCKVLDTCGPGDTPGEEPETPDTADEPDGEPEVEVAPAAAAVPAAPNFTG